ncbi:MAG TPA: hypothetical protein VFA28_13320 [Bryobacteraceae bacterium]|nr:hypothetical protein [Bryobacteraceae bacterium]
MRRLVPISLSSFVTVLLAVTLAACKSRKPESAPAAEDSSAELASMVHAADPRAAVQLTSGFHPVEQNAWRWTMGRFSVVAKPPAGAAQKGATLVLKFVIPDIEMQKLKSMTLSAATNGVKLEPETYTAPGEHTYSRDVPASAMTGNAVTVNFALDKFLPPSESDNRELGLIVSTVGFEAKP